LVVLAIAGRSSVSITPKLIWNASASAPIGLYMVRTAADLGVTDLVAVDAPEPLASFLGTRIPAARRAADEAHRSAPWTNGVPYRTQR
jgi:type IV secretory pathway protease TraF